MSKDEFKNISSNLMQIIDNLIEVNGYGCIDLFSADKNRQTKIDLLERAIEILRIEQKHLDNDYPMEEFLQGNLEVVGSKIKFTAPDKRKKMGSGTTPIRLQPKLLLYLLYRHNNGYEPVYNIIEHFIKVIWESLDILDFKKTRTGVLRCFTNTRFAALTLRDYGLLRFTKKEAYKTWVLSLPGILVASKVMEENSWKITEYNRELNFDLHADIRNAFAELQSYEKFTQRLTSICKPDTKIFADFKEGSKRAYALMADYWQILNNSEMPIVERKKKCTAKLKQIEQDPEIKRFFYEFASCLKIGDILHTT